MAYPTVRGLLPPQETRIRDLVTGQQGYTVPWAYTRETGELDVDFVVREEKGGTCSLRVKCTGINTYEIEFEEPVYRNPFGPH